MSAIARVEPNFIDRIVTIVNPAAGAARQKARTMLALSGAYTGARSDRRQAANWFPSRGSADSDTLYDLQILRARSRDLSRNSPIALGAINTVCQNAVGTGLTLQPTPDTTILNWDEKQAAEWVSMVEHEFALFAESKDCDASRTQSFYQMQELALRSALESGDVFALLAMRPIAGSPYKTAVQLVEADRVMSPYGHVDGTPVKSTDNKNQVWAGVEVDVYGAPVAYMIFHKHPGSSDFMASYKDNTLFDRVPAYGEKTNRRNVIHLFDRRRPDQKRGVPYVSPVIEMIKQLDRYIDAEMMAAVVTANFTVFVTTPNDPDATGPFVGQSGSSSNYGSGQAGGISMGPGMINQLGPGEKVEFADTLRPNTGFDPFVISILRQIGVALELPFEVLIKHFTASYSAARASLLEAWKFYKNRRNFVAEGFCQPIYEAWMDEAVAIGRISAPGYFSDPLLRRAYVSATWVGDAPGSIDPGKDADASKTLVAEGFSTIKRETMMLTGQDSEQVHSQRAREHQKRFADGLEPAVLNTTATEMVDPGADQSASDGGDDTEKPDVPAKQPQQPPTRTPVRGGKR